MTCSDLSYILQHTSTEVNYFVTRNGHKLLFLPFAVFASYLVLAARNESFISTFKCKLWTGNEGLNMHGNHFTSNLDTFDMSLTFPFQPVEPSHDKKRYKKLYMLICIQTYFQHDVVCHWGLKTLIRVIANRKCLLGSWLWLVA